MRLQAPDGTQYEVVQGKESAVVNALRHTMMSVPGSNQAYMERVGNLVHETYGKVIDTENDCVFLKCLLELGLLKEI